MSPTHPAVSNAEQTWRDNQQRWLTASRRGLMIGISGIILMAPWECWSIGWPWYTCQALAIVSLLSIPWFGGQLNWQAFSRPWCWGLLVFIIAVFISTVFSRDPATSVRYLRKDLLVYATVFLGTVLGSTSPALLQRYVMILAMSGLLACSMSVVTHYHFIYGADEVTRAQWLEEEVVSQDDPSDIGTLRAQFPLEHHNKLGFFAAVCTLVLLHVALSARRMRWLWFVAVAVPVWALILTLNRGGLVGLVVSLVAVVTLWNWKWMLGLIALGVVGLWLILPPRIVDHYRTIIDPSTYTDNEWSSMVYRFRGWRGAVRIIQDYPAFGVGYSWKNFEAIYDQYAVPEEVQAKPHAHSIWLETAVEVGIVGALGFMVFQLGLLGASVREWWRQGRPLGVMGTLIALQLIVITVGLISYYMRKQLGVVIWMILAISVATLYFERIRHDETQGDKA